MSEDRTRVKTPFYTRKSSINGGQKSRNHAINKACAVLTKNNFLT
jgi:hypothetical protein